MAHGYHSSGLRLPASSGCRAYVTCVSVATKTNPNMKSNPILTLLPREACGHGKLHVSMSRQTRFSHRIFAKRMGFGLWHRGNLYGARAKAAKTGEEW